MRIRTLLKQQLRRVGLEVNRFNASGSFTARRQRMMDSAMIDLVLDVGASDGGFANELRASGYGEEIISFEPLDAPFRSLMAKSKRDSKWNAYQYALGNQSDTVPINISRDDKCSYFSPHLNDRQECIRGRKSLLTPWFKCDAFLIYMELFLKRRSGFF